MKYAELAQWGDRMSALAARDLEHFTRFHYGEDLPRQVQTQTDAFKALLPDIYYEGQQMMKTEEKVKHREGLKVMLEELRFRAQLALGKRSNNFELFRFSGLNRMNDKKLVSYAKHILETSQELLAQLETRGIDQTTLDKIAEATRQLDQAIDRQAKAIAQRERKGVERVEKANALYDMILELCEVGKRIWKNQNSALYQDYVLYGSKTQSPRESPKEEKQDKAQEEEVAEKIVPS